jgi:hypothetical protein
MMVARQAAFESRPTERNFNRELFHTQTYRLRQQEQLDPPSALADLIADHLATPPYGEGIGYFLLEGASAGRTVEQVRELSYRLLGEVWERFRGRCVNLQGDNGRTFDCAQTLTKDGSVPIELFGSRWSFKPPHADRNGVIFAHVYGPTRGFTNGEVLLVDALSYAFASSLTFDEVIAWSDEPREQKPVLRAAHVDAAVARYGRNLGVMDEDKILFVNNTPNGLFHGATEPDASDGVEFLRMYHRTVIRERSSAYPSLAY